MIENIDFNWLYNCILIPAIRVLTFSGRLFHCNYLLSCEMDPGGYLASYSDGLASVGVTLGMGKICSFVPFLPLLWSTL